MIDCSLALLGNCDQACEHDEARSGRAEFWIGIAMWPVGGIVAKVMQKKGLGSETSAINAER